MLKHFWRFFLLVFMTLAACSPQPVNPPPAPTETAVQTATAKPLPSSTPSPQPQPTVEPEPSAPPPDPVLEAVCSPLELFTLTDLPGIISNPYQAPLPGLDDGHHGVDFAFYSYPQLGLDHMKGHPIHAALSGRVIAVNDDLTPYGHTAIIETPLKEIPANWQAAWQLPQPAPLDMSLSPLSCPEFNPPAEWHEGPLSLYLLYAHMDQPPEVTPGQEIVCGDRIGTVGTSGASVNDHLHFEARVGPSGASFENLGHYNTVTTEEDRRNYCVWRISGWFQLTDPMLMLNPQVQ